jgi:hypothetical protein
MPKEKEWLNSNPAPYEHPVYDWLEWEVVPNKPKTRADIIAELKRRNPHRWWRVNHDYRWLKRRMKKMGYNPDDAKELLQ